MNPTNQLRAAQLICDMFRDSADLRMHLEMMDDADSLDLLLEVQENLLRLFARLQPTLKSQQILDDFLRDS